VWGIKCLITVIFYVGFCRRVRETAKTMGFVFSVRPSVRVKKFGSQMDRFSWNFIFGYFSNMRRENSSFIKIWQE